MGRDKKPSKQEVAYAVLWSLWVEIKAEQARSGLRCTVVAMGRDQRPSKQEAAYAVLWSLWVEIKSRASKK